MYRGQMIIREELEKLQENINGLIWVNCARIVRFDEKTRKK